MKRLSSQGKPGMAAVTLLNPARMAEIRDGSQGVRFAGNANNGNCAPRNVNGNNNAGNTNTNYGGSAEIGIKHE